MTGDYPTRSRRASLALQSAVCKSLRCGCKFPVVYFSPLSVSILTRSILNVTSF
jgi:hypothetical protein